jgi:hypothetical protein
MKMLLGAVSGLVFAATVVQAEPEAAEKSATPVPLAGSLVKELPDGTVDVGGVIVDKEKRSIRFPAAVNMRKGYIEYLLVGAPGKTHESALVTKISPQFVHVAMLLLGAKGAPKAEGDPARAPGNIDEAYLAQAPKIEGDPVRIEASWKIDDKLTRVPVETLITMGDPPQPVPAGEWVYNGSLVIEGQFIAQADQSFITLIADPGALVNNPRPERVKDDIWQSNPEVIPPEGTPVDIIITLTEPGSPLPKPAETP